MKSCTGRRRAVRRDQRAPDRGRDRTPVPVAVAVGALVGTASAAIAGTSLLTGALISGALAGAQALLAPKPPKFSPAGAAAVRPDTRGTAIAGVEGARWVLGTARTAGSLKFYQETASGRVVWMAFALSEGACESIERVFVDGKEVTFTRSANALTLGMSTDGETNYAGKAFIYQYFDADGTQGTEIRAACSNFTANHKFEEVSWMAVKLTQPAYKRCGRPVLDQTSRDTSGHEGHAADVAGAGRCDMDGERRGYPLLA